VERKIGDLTELYATETILARLIDPAMISRAELQVISCLLVPLNSLISQNSSAPLSSREWTGMAFAQLSATFSTIVTELPAQWTTEWWMATFHFPQMQNQPANANEQ
jgi:hypothetical protein